MTYLARASILFFLVLLAACGGGSGGPAPATPGEPDFLVLPQPPTTGRAGLNQKPPAELLDEQLVPRARGPVQPLTEEERAEAEAAGRAAAREHMGERKFGPEEDVQVLRVQRDEYGGLHVKMCQTHRSVPVLGTGIGCHTVPGLDTIIRDNLIDGLDVDVVPGRAVDAVKTSMDRYAEREETDGEVPIETASRLAILPTLDWVKRRSSREEDHTNDFDRELVAATLVYEVLVAPVMPSDEDIIGGMLGQADGTESDDASTAEERRKNPVRAGLDEEEPSSHRHDLKAILQPAVRYLVDAKTGEVLREDPLIDHDFLPAEGVGYSATNGVVPVSVTYNDFADIYYLMDIERPWTGPGPTKIGSYVLDAGNVATHEMSDMSFILDWNNQWGDGSIFDSEGSAPNTARRQTPAVDVAHGIQMTWDFLDKVLGRWGPAGDGTRTRACVHYGDGYSDAHYNGSSRFICFGDGSTIGGKGNYGLQTVAHELGHAFWHAVGNGTEGGEAKALNEGNGDILGGLVHLWKATGAGKGPIVRRFPLFANWRWRVVNPDGYDEEDAGETFPGLKYWSSSLEDGPEHVGGLPYGRAMIYLAEGAPSDSENTLWTTEFPSGLGGIGITRAALIWHYAQAYLITGSPDYPDMRQAWLDAAQVLFGVGSMPDRAVRRAFAAIRVGNSWGDPNPPSFAFAHVWDVNTKDMTAAILAIPTDDTGFRELQVNGHANLGHYRGDIFLGHASIARAPVGMSNFEFTIVDSAGQTATVQRPFLKPRDRNLIVNGDFESDMDGWTSDSGDDHVLWSTQNAFIGERYLIMEGNDRVYQDVAIPAGAEDVCLVFRVLVRDSTTDIDSLRLTIQDPGGGVVQTLATFDRDTPDTRNWINKGYLRQEIDLTPWAGQTVRLAFVNDTGAGLRRFSVDQVVLTYEEEVSVGVPQVEVAEYDHTVSFRLPDIEGVPSNEIDRVDWYIDGVFVGAGENGATDYFGSYFSSSLTPGAHWVGGRVRGLDNSILRDSVGVWFETGTPVNELLPDGGFEGGAWDLTYGDPPPKVQVIPNGSYPKTPFRGTKAIKMGGLGEVDETRVGVELAMPGAMTMASLTLSVRIDTDSDEDAVDGTPMNDDALWVEFWDMSDFSKIGEYYVARFTEQYGGQGWDYGWRGYIRKEISLPTWPLAGKNVMMRLFTRETATKQTTFFVDNVSLRYATWGVTQGN